MLRLNKITVLTIIVIIFSLIPSSVEVGFSINSPSNMNCVVDIFTQKKPFSGKGPNATSDSFGPGEVVVLYATVEYNGQPLHDHLVTFYVKSPNGSIFTTTSTTNITGVASTSFRLPHSNETFGEWSAWATTSVGDHIFQDSLTFKFDWLVKITSVKTIDANLAPKNHFGKRGEVGLEIALRNIAFTEKNVTIAVTLMDDLKVPVDFLEINDFEVPPNAETLLYCKVNIPSYAFVGRGKIIVSALTAPPSLGGVAYCPSVSTEFWITLYEPLRLDFHDAAIIRVAPLAAYVKIGEPIYVFVKVRNEGTLTESFKVNLLMNAQLVGTQNVLNVTPYTSVTLNFTVDTASMAPGRYLISACIPLLTNEADITDNTYIDGCVEVKPPTIKFLVTFGSVGLTLDAQNIVLTVNGSAKTVRELPCSLLIEGGTTLTYEYKETILSTVSGKRFKLYDVTGPPSPLVVDRNITIIGCYKTQYYLLVSSIYGAPTPQSGWFDAGTVVTVSVYSPWPGPRGIRYVCLGWLGTGSAPPSGNDLMVTFTISQPSSILWLWKTQYYLTVISPYGITSGEGWYDANETAYALLDIDVFDHGNGTRRVFVSWSGDASGTNYVRSNSICMNGPKTAIANWKTQYLLTVTTNPADLNPKPSRSPPGEVGLTDGWWYDAYTNVTLKAMPVKGYDFEYWNVDGLSWPYDVDNITVCMDRPHLAVAHYTVKVNRWLYIILLVIIILFIALIAALTYHRVKVKKRRGKEDFYRGWVAWYYGYNLRRLGALKAKYKFKTIKY